MKPKEALHISSSLIKSWTVYSHAHIKAEIKIKEAEIRSRKIKKMASQLGVGSVTETQKQFIHSNDPLTADLTDKDFTDFKDIKRFVDNPPPFTNTQSVPTLLMRDEASLEAAYQLREALTIERKELTEMTKAAFRLK